MSWTLNVSTHCLLESPNLNWGWNSNRLIAHYCDLTKCRTLHSVFLQVCEWGREPLSTDWTDDNNFTQFSDAFFPHILHSNSTVSIWSISSFTCSLQIRQIDFHSNHSPVKLWTLTIEFVLGKFHKAHSQCWGDGLLTFDRREESGWSAVIATRHPPTLNIYGVEPVYS